MTTNLISIRIEFGGGMELLFDNVRSHSVQLPALIPDNQTPVNVAYLVPWIRDNLLKERVELFMEGKSVRPGILVLINDTDWELEGEGDYELQDGDEVVFISTLHGG
jgi:ubiquitin related modifier 1